MILEHDGRAPSIDPTAYVAPTAVVSGDVTLGPATRVLFGAVITSEGGPVSIGAHCIIMENAVLRATGRGALTLGDHVLVGPRAYLTCCTVCDNAFLATGATVFNGSTIGNGAEVRVNGVVHLKTALPPETVVPIGWVAVGDPAIIRPPGAHDDIWRVQEPLNFPKTVFGLERAPMGELMPEMTRRYSRRLGKHNSDREVR